jgi:hypothetical protein
MIGKKIDSIEGLSTDVLTPTRVLLDQPYWNVFLYVEEDDVDGANKNCGTPGRSKYCCAWYNKFFVLDFIVVVVAIILENYVDISLTFQYAVSANDIDLAALSEATILLLAVRFWRFLRVFHGLLETANKLKGEKGHIEAAIEHRDAVLQDLVLLNEQVEKGEASDKEFRLKFMKSFESTLHAINRQIQQELDDLKRLAKVTSNSDRSYKRASALSMRIQKKQQRK